MNGLGKYYFVSDAHLGIPDYNSSLLREKKLVQWLDLVKNDAAGIFLMGDIFDFWFEYRDVVPKYFVRLLGKLAELTDAGIPVWFFKGNHDMWTFGYLERELNITLITNQLSIELNGKSFFLAHGDGLGPKDQGYKMIKSIFRNKVSCKLFSMLHPRIGFSMANYSSMSSRDAHSEKDKYFGGENEEALVLFSRKKLESCHFDYFVFGHRHLAMQIKLNDNSNFINLGDWVRLFSYGVFDGEQFLLKEFDSETEE